MCYCCLNHAVVILLMTVWCNPHILFEYIPFFFDVHWLFDWSPFSVVLIPLPLTLIMWITEGCMRFIFGDILDQRCLQSFISSMRSYTRMHAVILSVNSIFVHWFGRAKLQDALDRSHFLQNLIHSKRSISTESVYLFISFGALESFKQVK